MIRKLLIVPFFGPLPEWFPLWEANIERLQQWGYDMLVDRDLAAFEARVSNTLGIWYPCGADPRKPCDFRPMLGRLYAGELSGYDFWGHTDIDCAYGRVGLWMPDRLLAEIDVWSNDQALLCGPWTLWRNTPDINKLYEDWPDWHECLEAPELFALDERPLPQARIRAYHTHWQSDPSDHSALRWDGDKLVEDGREEFLAHFNRQKTYPDRLR